MQYRKSLVIFAATIALVGCASLDTKGTVLDGQAVEESLQTFGGHLKAAAPVVLEVTTNVLMNNWLWR